jgi:alpha-glucosidase
VLDSTYKTNKYRLPLLEFVGTTSTEQTFSIGFALLSAEKESNFNRVFPKSANYSVSIT